MADNKAVMQRFYDEVVNGGRLELIDELLTDDFVEHEDFPGLTPDRDGVKQFFASFRSAFPDARMDPEHLLADGDFVVGHLRVTGTHQGEFLGVPATGRQVDFPAIDIVRFRDGKGVEHWGVTDVMTMMEQLGAIPGPG